MATDKEASCLSCASDPNFAVICSFLDKFSSQCGIASPSFAELQDMLEDTQSVSQVLIDLHVKLLRKARKSFTADKWERALSKFCHTYSQQDGWELERFGYKKARLEVKVKLLKVLLETQFDNNTKFKAEVNKISPTNLRLEPLGRDQTGLTYWCQFDPSSNVRVYSEDVDEDSWELVAKDRGGLVQLIDSLSHGEGQAELNNILNEDSTSQEIEKPIIDTGQNGIEDSEGEEEDEEGEEADEDEKMESDEEELEEGDEGERDVKEIDRDVEELDQDEEELDQDEEELDQDEEESDRVETELDQDEKELYRDEKELDQDENNRTQEDNIDESRYNKNEEEIYNKETVADNNAMKVNGTVKEIPTNKIIENGVNHSDTNESSLSGVDLSVKTEPRNYSSPSSQQGNFYMVPDREPLPETADILSQMSARFNEKRMAEDLSNPSKKSKVEPEYLKPVNLDMKAKYEENQPLVLVKKKYITEPSDEPLPLLSGATIQRVTKEDSNSQPELSEAIEEPVRYVVGSGNGAECNDENPRFVTKIDEPHQPEFSEVIEEPILYIVGEGSGLDCSVGNPIRLTDSGFSQNCPKSFEFHSSRKQNGEEAQKTCKSSDASFETELSDVKEDPVFYVEGLGSGLDCDVGNPQHCPSNCSKPAFMATSIPEFSTIIEEPVHYVRGNGSGAECGVGSPRHSRNQPQHLNSNSFATMGIECSINNLTLCEYEESFSDVIEEPVMFVQGYGYGEDCLTGNDEKDEPSVEDQENKSKLWSINAICPEKDKEALSQTSESLTKSVKPSSFPNEIVGAKTEINSNEPSSLKPPSEIEPVEENIPMKDKPPDFQDSNSDDRKSSYLPNSIKDTTSEMLNLKETTSHLQDNSLDNTSISHNKTVNSNCNNPSKNSDQVSCKKNSEDCVVNSKNSGCEPPETLKNSNEMSKENKTTITENKTNSSQNSSEIKIKSSNGIVNENGPSNIDKSNSIDNEKEVEANMKADESGEKKNFDWKNVSISNIIGVCLDNANDNCVIKTKEGDTGFIELFTAKDLVNPPKKELLDAYRNKIDGKKKNKDKKKNEQIENSNSDTKDEKPDIKCENRTLGNTADMKIMKTSSNEKMHSKTNLEEQDCQKHELDVKIESGEESDSIEENNLKKKKYTKNKSNKDGHKRSGDNDNKEKDFKKKSDNDEGEDSKKNYDGKKEDQKRDNIEGNSEEKFVDDENTSKSLNDDKITKNENEVNEEIIEEVKQNVKGRKSRTNSLNDENDKEIPNKKPKTETIEKIPARRSTRRNNSSNSQGNEIKKVETTKKESKKTDSKNVDEKEKSNKKNEIKESGSKNESASLPTFSIEAQVEEANPPPLKNQNRKRRSSMRLSKSEEEGAEQEEEEEAGGKKPRLKGKVKKGKGKLTPSKPPPPETSSEEESNDEDEGKQTTNKGRVRTRQPPKRGKGRPPPTIVTTPKKSKLNKPKKEENEKESKKKTPPKKSESTAKKGKIEIKRKGSDVKKETDSDINKKGKAAVAEKKSKKTTPTKQKKSKDSKTEESEDEDDEENEEDEKNEEDDDESSEEDEKDQTEENVKKQKDREDVKKQKDKANEKKQKDKEDEKNQKDKDEKKQKDKDEKKQKDKEDENKQKGEEEGDDNKDGENEIEDDLEDSTPKKEEKKPKSNKSRSAKKKTLLGLTEWDLAHTKSVQASSSFSESTSMNIRQSRRIAQIKIKEQVDKDTIKTAKKSAIKEAKRKKKDEKKESPKKLQKKKGKITKSSEEEEEEEEAAFDEPPKEERKKRRKNKGLKFDEHRPWQSSSGSSSEEIEEDEDHYYEEEDEEDIRHKKIVSDHEFSPESDLEKDEDETDDTKPVRRARTAKKEPVQEDKEEDQSEDYPCKKCGLPNHPEWILLCDKCDCGYHASCLRPPIMIIPEGDWFCPPCQHADLVLKLKETLRTFEKNAKKRDNEELRRKRLAYVGISLANVLPIPEKQEGGYHRRQILSSSEEYSSDESESSDDEPVYQLRQRRAAGQTNYRFNDYDELINSAIQDEMEAVQGAGNMGRGKDIQNIVDAEKSEEKDGEKIDDNKPDDELQGADDDEEEEGGENWRPRVVPKITALPSLRKKQKKLTDLDMPSDDDGSDEDFKGSSEEEASTDDENDSDDSIAKIPVRRSERTRHSRIDREFINDSDTSDEPRRKKTKKLYASSSSDSSDTWGRRKRKSKSYSKIRSNKGRKKSTKYFDSDSDRPKKAVKPKRPKIKYGLSEDEDEPLKSRTRGKRVSYLDVQGSDTEEEVIRRSRKFPSDEEDEFVPDKDDEEEDEKLEKKKLDSREVSEEESEEEESGGEDNYDEKDGTEAKEKKSVSENASSPPASGAIKELKEPAVIVEPVQSIECKRLSNASEEDYEVEEEEIEEEIEEEVEEEEEEEVDEDDPEPVKKPDLPTNLAVPKLRVVQTSELMRKELEKKGVTLTVKGLPSPHSSIPIQLPPSQQPLTLGPSALPPIPRTVPIQQSLPSSLQSTPPPPVSSVTQKPLIIKSEPLELKKEDKEDKKETTVPAIRLVPPAKLLDPNKARRPMDEGVIRGMLGGGGSGGYYRPQHPQQRAGQPQLAPPGYGRQRFPDHPRFMYQSPHQIPPTHQFYPQAGFYQAGSGDEYGSSGSYEDQPPPPQVITVGGGPGGGGGGGGGEEDGVFSGLVSYFSSQRDEALDS